MRDLTLLLKVLAITFLGLVFFVFCAFRCDQQRLAEEAAERQMRAAGGGGQVITCPHCGRAFAP